MAQLLVKVCKYSHLGYVVNDLADRKGNVTINPKDRVEELSRGYGTRAHKIETNPHGREEPGDKTRPEKPVYQRSLAVKLFSHKSHSPLALRVSHCLDRF